VTGLVREGAIDNLIDYSSLGSSSLSIPTGEHYLPLLYVLAQQTPDDMITFFADRIVMGSLSMQSVRIG
jgi:4,5-DOPA dioxygenase extradiol